MTTAEATADAYMMLRGGTPTAYDDANNKLAQDRDAGVVIQAAIDHAQLGGGGRVEIDSGRYPYSSFVTAKSNVAVAGAGMDATTFVSQNAGAGWGGGGPIENFTIQDLTLDGNEQGNNTGFAQSKATDCWAVRVKAKNVGGRNGDSGSTPAIRYSAGSVRCHIVDCHARRCSSVSIECAINTEDCEIRGCSVREPIYNNGAGFTHGFSVEKGTNCRIVNCYGSGASPSGTFGPVLNINNVNGGLVAGNYVVDTKSGLNNANGPSGRVTIANNVFKNCATGMKIEQGNAGRPRDHVAVGNVFISGSNSSRAIDVSGGELDLYGNLFHGYDSIDNGTHIIRYRDHEEAPSIVGNVVRNQDGKILSVNDSANDSFCVIANNLTEWSTTSGGTNEAIVDIGEDRGVMNGNAWGHVVGNTVNGASTVAMTGADWAVTGNYVRSPAANGGTNYAGGLFGSNVVYSESGSTSNVGHGGTGTFVATDNVTVNGDVTLLGGPLTLGHARAATYTGDGTTGRTINTASNPEHVIVEDGSGTKYDVHAQFGTGFEYNAPSGELSLVDGGFRVGDNSADADPNTDTETYTFYAQ